MPSFSQSFSNTNRAKAMYLLLLPLLLLISRGLADVTVVLTGLGFLIQSGRSGGWQWCRQPWVLLSLLLVAYLFVSAPLGFNWGDSVKYALAYLRWPLFACALAYWLLTDKASLVLLANGVLFTLLFVMFDTVWQFIYGVDLFGIEKFDAIRLTGPMRNPVSGNLSLRLFFIGFFALAVANKRLPAPQKLVVQLSFLLVFCLFVFITGERMSLLLCLASGGLLLMGLALENRRLLGLILLWLLVMAVCFFGFFHYFPEVFARSITAMLASLANFANDPYGQVFYTGWQVWQQQPWTGVGLSNYAEYCDTFMRVADYNHCQRHPHNIYLHWLAETGLVGTGLFLLSLAALFQQIVRGQWLLRQPVIACCVLAMLFVNFWPLASSASFFNNWFAAIIWCGLGWSLAVAGVFSRQLAASGAVVETLEARPTC